MPGEILDVKRGMVENIDRVLDRGEKIDLLVDKAATLHSDAFRFKRTTRQVRRTFWWQHYGYLVRNCGMRQPHPRQPALRRMHMTHKANRLISYHVRGLRGVGLCRRRCRRLRVLLALPWVGCGCC